MKIKKDLHHRQTLLGRNIIEDYEQKLEITKVLKLSPEKIRM